MTCLRHSIKVLNHYVHSDTAWRQDTFCCFSPELFSPLARNAPGALRNIYPSSTLTILEGMNALLLFDIWPTRLSCDTISIKSVALFFSAYIDVLLIKSKFNNACRKCGSIFFLLWRLQVPNGTFLEFD